MRVFHSTSVALFCIAAGVAPGASAQERPETILVFPGANSHETYFTIHNIREAHAITKGKGAKIGILDHSFGFDLHPGFYGGGQAFQSDDWAQTFRSRSHHGYWMALVAREIAPDAEIYALGTTSSDEKVKVDAMVAAIDWAIAHRLDAITYSDRKFSPDLRAKLDAAVSRAIAAGVVVCFIHYPHPDNLLPTGLFPRDQVDDEREPDVNILQYDYTVVFASEYQLALEGKSQRGYQPFLSMSSTSPVTAAIVALMRSANPKLTPAQCKQILMSTARPMTFKGERAVRAVDAAAAVKRANDQARSR
jgi:subtilisin family serine protease